MKIAPINKNVYPFFALLVLAFILIFFKTEQFFQKQSLLSQQKKIYEQQKTLEEKKEELLRSLESLESPNFKEKLAKQQLNLKKEGEIVYNFQGNVRYNPEKTDTRTVSNPEKWWNFFFKERSKK